MNDVSDGFEIFNSSYLKFPFAQARCYIFHIITFFTNFVAVRLIVGLLVDFSLGRLRFEQFEVIISRLRNLVFKVRYRITKIKKPLDQVASSFLRLSLLVLIGTIGIISF